jgi:hypothetical protein
MYGSGRILLETALVTRRTVILLALLSITFLFIPKRSVNAGDDWLPIDPADLKMTSDPQAPGAPAVFLYRQVDRDDSGGVATTERDYQRVKILTEAGRDNANVEIPFVKGLYDISNIRARTIHPDGSIVNFDGKIYENTIVKAKGVKYLAKTFSLSEATVGSIIEYKYYVNFKDYNLFNSHWILSGDLFTRKAQFSLKPYLREGFSVRWVASIGLPKGCEDAKEGPDQVVRMNCIGIPAFQIEDMMPPENELKFRMDFLYSEGAPEMNPDKYWTSYVKKQNGRVESFIGKHKAMEEVVSQIVGAGDSQEVKLRKIYVRAQQIRNTSYEPRKSDQEAKHDKVKYASNVEELMKDGYGNGWSITWLFLGLARAAGFEAYPCIVSGRNEYFFTKQRLDGGQLTANVVLVRLNGKDMYFDPGAKFAPFGMLPWEETKVIGLKLDKDGGKWIETTLPESAASRIERSAKLTLSENGSLEGKVTVTYSGLEAVSRRTEMNNEDEAARKKYLEDGIKESIPVGSEVELTNKPNWVGPEENLVAEFDVKVPGWISGAGKSALLPVSVFGGDEKHLFEHSERVHPVYYHYPFEKVDDIKIELPLGWKATSVPKPFDEDLKAAEYKLTVEDGGTTLHIKREIRSDLMSIPSDMYPSLRGFYQIVRTEDDQQVVLKPGAASAGK